ncbi:unnamed protein product, partial [Ixodes hexagonus]
HEVEAAPNAQTRSRRLHYSHQAPRTCFSSRGVHGNRLRYRHLDVLGPERARAISVLPSRDQNIVIVHTPDMEAADRLIGDFAVNIDRGSIPLQGYLRQDGGNTCHGVVVVSNTDTTETLQHRVCWRAGTIVEIRKFGTSNKARITFAGKEKPRYVHYDNMVVSVQNYYKTIPACGQCGAFGHRADACSNLQPNTCRLCGLQAPLVEDVRAPHNCVPGVLCAVAPMPPTLATVRQNSAHPRWPPKREEKRIWRPRRKAAILGLPATNLAGKPPWMDGWMGLNPLNRAAACAT